MKKIHALVLPFPAQGHVIPLMKLSNQLSEHGFKITFVNTEYNHEKVVASLPKESNSKENNIHLVSIPDGREPGANRTDFAKVFDSILSSMPRYLEVLIREINESSDDRITCVIADEHMGWAVRVAKKMKIPVAGFWTAAAGLRTVHLHLEQMIETKILNSDGLPTKQQMIHLSPEMPAMNTDHFAWNCTGDSIVQQSMFRYISSNARDIKDADWYLINSVYKVEKSTYPLNTNLLPVGPLLAAEQTQLRGNFLAEDSTCLSWLDQQPAQSVIYLAFGSTTIFDKHQFHELALGLELTGQPFLWVVRPSLIDKQNDACPDGFQARVANKSRIVGWAPQQKVLAHPSIACFVTHCGWNSTMEGVAMGVPFLCRAYFCDQFLNQSYICDVWKVGLQLNKIDGGIISKEEFISKVKALLIDKMIRARALEFKEISKKSVSEGGSSRINLSNFIESVKSKWQN